MPEAPAAARSLSLFDAHYLLPFEDRFTAASFEERFFGNRWETGRFFRNCLLYDTICLPTVSVLIVPLLLRILGAARLVEALADGTIVLARYRGAIGYGGGGEGLTLRQVRTSLDGTVDASAGSAWRPTDEVLAELGERLGASGHGLAQAWPEIVKAVLGRIVEVDDAAFGPVARATYQEVAGNDAIRGLFPIEGGSPDALPGVAAGQVRWLAADRLNDGVDGMLHLAQDAFEAHLAEKLGARDRTSGPGAPKVLDARVGRAADSSALRQVPGSPSPGQRLARLLVLRHTPALAAAHGNEEVVTRLWHVRASDEGARLRRWFHGQLLDRPEEAEARFTEAVVRPVLGPILDKKDAVRPLGFVATEMAAGSGKLMLDTARGVLPDPGQVAPRVRRTRQTRFTMKRDRRVSA